LNGLLDIEGESKPLLIKIKKNNENYRSSNVKSRIGAVIKHEENNKYTTYSDNDDNDSNHYDPTKPMITNSVIKVPERKYNVPKSLQPNKSILLKAIDDANTSSAHSSRKQHKSEVSSIKSRLGELKNEKISQK